ncbi:MAG TPA: NUDIX domain-containing protein [Desulfobacterales bacterium]|nr:NUDIX domain-containing protein [Desulfobacterales bacterium]
MSRHAYPDKPQVAVGAIVMRDNKVLLVKRSQPPGKGLWAVPGGRVELGETLQEAAEREVREETGITVRARNPVCALDLIDRDDAGRVRFHYVIVDIVADYVGGKANPNDDASEVRWATSQEMEELPTSKTTKELLKNTVHLVATRKKNRAIADPASHSRDCRS